MQPAALEEALPEHVHSPFTDPSALSDAPTLQPSSHSNQGSGPSRLASRFRFGRVQALARGQSSSPPPLQLSSPVHSAVSTFRAFPTLQTLSPQPPTLLRPSTGGANDRPGDPPSRYRSMVENQATAKAVQCVNSQAEIKKNDELVFVASLINHCQSITDRRTPLAPFSLLAQPALGILRLKQSPAKRPVPNRRP